MEGDGENPNVNTQIEKCQGKLEEQTRYIMEDGDYSATVPIQSMDGAQLMAKQGSCESVGEPHKKKSKGVKLWETNDLEVIIHKTKMRECTQRRVKNSS